MKSKGKRRCTYQCRGTRLPKLKRCIKGYIRVIAPIARSEYKVYDYLMETAACTQTRENVNKFAEKCKDFKVAKAEILNIINLRPSSIVELTPIIEKPDDRGIDLDGILELVNDLLPPLPTTESHQENNEEETENGEQSQVLTCK